MHYELSSNDTDLDLSNSALFRCLRTGGGLGELGTVMQTRGVVF